MRLPDHSIQKYHQADNPLPRPRRRLFLRSKVFDQSAQTQDGISKLRTRIRSGDDVPPGWDFYLQFAVFCVAGSEVATAIEQIRPSNLGCRPDLGLSTVKSLALFFELVKHLDAYYYGTHSPLYIQVRDRFFKAHRSQVYCKNT
jgi:hypothetical protein